MPGSACTLITHHADPEDRYAYKTFVEASIHALVLTIPFPSGMLPSSDVDGDAHTSRVTRHRSFQPTRFPANLEAQAKFGAKHNTTRTKMQ